MNNTSFFAKQNSIVKLFMLVMTLWMVWFIGSALVGQVRDFFVKSEEVHYVTLERTESGYGVLSLTEYLIYATADGTVEQVVPEGERVRKGHTVFRVGDVDQYANHAGRVSYLVDGLESIADIGVIASLDLREKYNEQQKRKSKVATAEVDIPYAKVQETMGGAVLYVLVANTDQTDDLSIGQSIRVRLVDSDTVVRGNIAEVLVTADGNRCMKLDVSKTDDAFYQQRIYEIELPYVTERVITIPKQALAKKHGVDGVYYLHKGFVFWKEVTVNERWIDQEVLVVEDGVKEGDIIVTTPKLVREGENIKF